jgi:hypothetical protein
MLDDQDVMRLFLGDHEVRVSALGMQRIGGDDAPGQVQGLQQRGERGDLVRLAIHTGLGEHGAGALIEGSQQVHGLPVAAGVPGSPHCLAVHGHRPAPALALLPPLASGPQPRFQPGPHGRVEGRGINGFQDPADGGLIWRPGPAGQRVTAHSESSQHLRRRVRHPLAHRGKRLRPGQHGRHRGQ